jgi:deazaflavin-dependent oxidoreductase (nitroreductase family)
MPATDEYMTSPDSFVRNHIEKVLATGTTASINIKDRPVVLITMRGAKSGRLRRVPVMRVEHDGTYAIVASKGGSSKHPVWYHNVKADPLLELQDGTEVRRYCAREVVGDERDAWWERAVEAFPDYARYQARADRELPVFVLELD